MKLRLFRMAPTLTAGAQGRAPGREGQAGPVPGVVPIELGHLTNDNARAVLEISGTA